MENGVVMETEAETGTKIRRLWTGAESGKDKDCILQR